MPQKPPFSIKTESVRKECTIEMSHVFQHILRCFLFSSDTHILHTILIGTTDVLKQSSK